MKKIKLAALLLTAITCAGCNFYEIEDGDSLDSSDVAGSLPQILTPTDTAQNSVPVNLPSSVEKGEKIIDTFNTKGLDGKTYNQTMFRGKLTLLNMWGTYCGPCITEMPYLARCHKKYEESDFQVVGVLIDIGSYNNVNSSKKTKADSIVSQAGVTYTSILPCDGLVDFINSTEYIPYSVFIDEDGRQCGEAVTGSMDYSAWDKLIKSMLYTYMY